MMGGGGLAVVPEASEAKKSVESGNQPDEAEVDDPMRPDVSLEWSGIKVTFSVVGSSDDTAYELFPNVDSAAPSVRSLRLLKRLKQRTASKKATTTLSGYIGSSSSASPANSVDELSTNTSENLPDGAEKVKTCPICKRGFTKATYLKGHILSHSSVKPYECEICNWGFFQYCNLKRHMASHTLQNGGPGFQCSHCKATFTTRSVLSVHMREAHGDTLVTKKAAQQQQSLIKQQNTSQPAKTDAEPTQPENNAASPVTVNNLCHCKICGKKFLTPANLKQHMTYHTGPSTFKCTLCGARFTQRINLKKHMVLSHSSGHRCNKCGITFMSANDLTQHVLNLHPGAQPKDDTKVEVGANDDDSQVDQN